MGAGAPAAPAAPPAGRGRGAAPPPATGPLGYALQVSTDGSTWSAPLAQGKGSATTVIAFKPIAAKFIKITQTGTATNTDFWSVAQMRVYQAGK